MGAGFLRAIGDSQRPFYFLIAAALTNTVLDLVFVFWLDMGVAGVALATVIAQTLSAILTLIALFKTDTCVKLNVKKIKFEAFYLKKIAKVGFPAAIQMAITSFSNIFVQSYINYFGDDVMAGWTAYGKIDQLMFLPMQSLALASTTFVAQNLGRGYEERAKKGISRTVLIAVISTVVLMIPVITLAPYLVAFFNKAPEVIEAGTLFLTWITPFYICCCFNQVYAAAQRGAGNSRAPMFIMLGSFVLFRQVYLYVMANFICNEIVPIAMAYPAGWFLCSLINTIYYHKTPLDRHVVVERPRKGETT
jgi:putative MATE family efflux protein